jgi:hypothetical protein
MSVTSAQSYVGSGSETYLSTRLGSYAALAISIAAIATSGWVFFTAAKAAAYYGLIIGATSLSIVIAFNAYKVAMGFGTRANRAVGGLCLLAMTVAFSLSCLATWFHARDSFSFVLICSLVYLATFVSFSWDFSDSPEG